MSLDDIGHILQYRCCPLLAVIFDIAHHAAGVTRLHGSGYGTHRQFSAHLVAADGLKADGVQYHDAVNLPTNGRFPMDGFENTPRCRWGDHIVADPLNLHFWPRETGAFSPDF